MPIVQTFGALHSMSGQPASWGPGSDSRINLYGRAQTYATIYATQPNVRTCVDFLSRNVAQLGIHIYRRLSDTDRERLIDHDLAAWLSRPNPATSAYRLIESLMADLGIYFNAYWLKVRHQGADGRDRIGLVALPPDQMDVEGTLLPTQFTWTVNGRRRDFPLSEVVHFDGYNPLNRLKGLSPLETLRRVLAEEDAAGQHREAFWRNGARFDGVVERPLAAPKWNKDQKNDWREQWQMKFGSGGSHVGSVAVLEDGMTFKPNSQSARDSEYSTARKLTREECAAAFHIPLPLVGILEHATFSNIREQHKHLYQDCLGPWMEMIQQELENQLLVECEDQRDVYCEFNIAAKLAGAFEEQAASLRALVGRPIMTANEGRARLNLPSHDDASADEIAAQQGGPSDASVRPAFPGGEAPPPTATDVTPVIHAARLRQQARIGRVPVAARATEFAALLGRWNRELEADLLPLVHDTTEARRLAIEANAETLARLQDEANQ
jgi:HK97 family phage portal protein